MYTLSASDAAFAHIIWQNYVQQHYQSNFSCVWHSSIKADLPASRQMKKRPAEKRRLTSHIQYCKQACYIVSYFDVYSSDAILFFTAKHLRAFWQRRFRFSGSHSRNATYWSFSTGLHWQNYFLHITYTDTKKWKTAAPRMTICH